MEEQYITTNTAGKYYYKDKAKTILHRLDGPAVEYPNGYKVWYVNGKRHRLDGPASEWANDNGDKTWYVNGEFIFSVNREGKLVGRMR
jgi:hypothetical protein